MKKSLREQLVKQWLNTFMWSRYLNNINGDECSLIVNHHQGFDTEELTTDCFDLNFSLLKALRGALQSAPPYVFTDFFAFEKDLPRKVQQRTKLYATFKFATDKQLAAVCPLFGGCLFQPRNQAEIVQHLTQHEQNKPVSEEALLFNDFIEMYWISAWQHATKMPLLTPTVFGLDPALVDILRLTTSQRILQFIRSHADTKFIIKMDENILYASAEQPTNKMVRLFQIINLIHNRMETDELSFKENDDV